MLNKKRNLFLLSITILTLIFALSACKGESYEEVLTSLSVDTSSWYSSGVGFSKGEPFLSDGLKIERVYSGGMKEEILDHSILNFKIGDRTITLGSLFTQDDIGKNRALIVSLKENSSIKSNIVSVDIYPEVKNVSVIHGVKNTYQYENGSYPKLDLSALALHVTYDNNIYKEIPSHIIEKLKTITNNSGNNILTLQIKGNTTNSSNKYRSIQSDEVVDENKRITISFLGKYTPPLDIYFEGVSVVSQGGSGTSGGGTTTPSGGGTSTTVPVPDSVFVSVMPKRDYSGDKTFNVDGLELELFYSSGSITQTISYDNNTKDDFKFTYINGDQINPGDTLDTAKATDSKIHIEYIPNGFKADYGIWYTQGVNPVTSLHLVDSVGTNYEQEIILSGNPSKVYSIPSDLSVEVEKLDGTKESAVNVMGNLDYSVTTERIQDPTKPNLYKITVKHNESGVNASYNVYIKSRQAVSIVKVDPNNILGSNGNYFEGDYSYPQSQIPITVEYDSIDSTTGKNEREDKVSSSVKYTPSSASTLKSGLNKGLRADITYEEDGVILTYTYNYNINVYSLPYWSYRDGSLLSGNSITSSDIVDLTLQDLPSGAEAEYIFEVGDVDTPQGTIKNNTSKDIKINNTLTLKTIIKMGSISKSLETVSFTINKPTIIGVELQSAINAKYYENTFISFGTPSLNAFYSDGTSKTVASSVTNFGKSISDINSLRVGDTLTIPLTYSDGYSSYTNNNSNYTITIVDTPKFPQGGEVMYTAQGITLTPSGEYDSLVYSVGGNNYTLNKGETRSITSNTTLTLVSATLSGTAKGINTGYTYTFRLEDPLVDGVFTLGSSNMVYEIKNTSSYPQGTTFSVVVDNISTPVAFTTNRGGNKTFSLPIKNTSQSVTVQAECTSYTSSNIVSIQNVPGRSLQSISFESDVLQESGKKYYLGSYTVPDDTLYPQGAIILHYNDGTSESRTLSSLSGSFSNVDLISTGTKTIEYTYSGKKCSYTVEIIGEPTLTSSATFTYKIGGDDVYLSGLQGGSVKNASVLPSSYTKDSRSENIRAVFNIQENTTINNIVVTLNGRDLSLTQGSTFKVALIEPTLNRSDSGSAINYIITNASLYPAGSVLVVNVDNTVHRSDDAQSTFFTRNSQGNLTFSIPKDSTSHTVKIHAECTGYENSSEYTPQGVPVSGLSSIAFTSSILSESGKKYYIGSYTLPTDAQYPNGVIILTHEDGSAETKHLSELTGSFDNVDLTTTGDKTIKYSYGGKECSYTVRLIAKPTLTSSKTFSYSPSGNDVYLDGLQGGSVNSTSSTITPSYTKDSNNENTRAVFNIKENTTLNNIVVTLNGRDLTLSDNSTFSVKLPSPTLSPFYSHGSTTSYYVPGGTSLDFSITNTSLPSGVKVNYAIKVDNANYGNETGVVYSQSPLTVNVTPFTKTIIKVYLSDSSNGTKYVSSESVEKTTPKPTSVAIPTTSSPSWNGKTFYTGATFETSDYTLSSVEVQYDNGTKVNRTPTNVEKNASFDTSTTGTKSITLTAKYTEGAWGEISSTSRSYNIYVVSLPTLPQSSTTLYSSSITKSFTGVQSGTSITYSKSENGGAAKDVAGNSTSIPITQNTKISNIRYTLNGKTSIDSNTYEYKVKLNTPTLGTVNEGATSGVGTFTVNLGNNPTGVTIKSSVGTLVNNTVSVNRTSSNQSVSVTLEKSGFVSSDAKTTTIHAKLDKPTISITPSTISDGAKNTVTVTPGGNWNSSTKVYYKVGSGAIIDNGTSRTFTLDRTKYTTDQSITIYGGENLYQNSDTSDAITLTLPVLATPAPTLGSINSNGLYPLSLNSSLYPARSYIKYKPSISTVTTTLPVGTFSFDVEHMPSDYTINISVLCPGYKESSPFTYTMQGSSQYKHYTTGSVSPNSKVGETDPKKMTYVANEQGYVLEFRLSENTVDSYEAYCTERDKYTGTNGLDGGNWKPLKNWFVDNGFISSFDNLYSENYPSIPKKNGSAALGSVVIQVAQKFAFPLLSSSSTKIVAGCKDTSALNNADKGDSYAQLAQTDGNGQIQVVLTTYSGVCFNDFGWNITGSSSYILLVRPL